MQKEDLYTHRMDPKFVVRVGGVKDGVVSFAAEGGGFVYEVPTADSKAERLTYEKGAVTLESWSDVEGGFQLPAWLNGTRWNGWLMPAFEKQDLLRAIEKEMLYGAFYHEASDAFVVLSNNAGDLPAFDTAVVLPRVIAQADGTDYLDVDVDGTTLEATIYRGRDISQADGTTVRVYDLGSGYYCWERAEPADEPANSPTP